MRKIKHIFSNFAPKEKRDFKSKEKISLGTNGKKLSPR